MTGSVASGSQENCCMIGEHMYTINLFFKNIIKTENSLRNLFRLGENFVHLDTRLQEIDYILLSVYFYVLLVGKLLL